LDVVDSTKTFGKSIAQKSNYFLSKLTFLDEDTILAGAMEKLYLLDSKLNERNVLTWNALPQNAERCEMHVKDRPKFVCKNHIRFFQPFPQVSNGNSSSPLLVCGTGALFPNCTIIESLDDFQINKNKLYQPRPGMVLLHPDLTGFQTFRNLKPGDTYLFSAQHRSFQMETYGFAYHDLKVVDTPDEGHRITSMAPVVNSAETKKHWLRSPVAFIDGYDDNFSEEEEDPDRLDFLFFFFHEQAYDIRNGDMKIHSRVARVCKNDPGVQDGSKLVFSSYVKARITCLEKNNFKDVTHPGAVKFFYNVIRKVKLMKGSSYKPDIRTTDRILYGAFTGDRLGPQGSAICVYNATRSLRRPNNNGIYDIFNRDYVDVRENINGECDDDRKTTPNLYPFDCSAPRSPEKAKSENLIYAMVSQLESYPLVVVKDATIVSMEVDQTLVLREGKVVPQDVIFVGTDGGEVRKIFIAPHDAEPGYKANDVETLMLEPHSFVHHMTLRTITNDEGDKEKVIYANTNSTLFRLPLQRCARYLNCIECIAARDPYCFWSVSDNKCTTLKGDAITGDTVENYLQDVDFGDYTKFVDKCPGRSQHCADIRDCPDGSFCSLPHLNRLPAPSSLFTGKMRGEYIQREFTPMFYGEWTMFIRFWHRRPGAGTLLYLGANRANGMANLLIDVLPTSKDIRLWYKPLNDINQPMRAERMPIRQYRKLSDGHVNCLAVSYTSTGTFSMYFRGEEWQHASGGADFRYNRDKSVFILGSGPYGNNKLAGKVNATLYYPTLLDKEEISSVCSRFQGTFNYSGYCQPDQL
jgi:hypothetical protein